MESDALKIARARYDAAYHAYLERAKHVAATLQRKGTPSAEEIEAERRAREVLALARSELIKAINDSVDR